MKLSNRSIGFRPDPLVAWAVITLTALSLTLAAQVHAEGLGGTSHALLRDAPGCRHLMPVTDTRAAGMPSRSLRARQPCVGEMRGLRTMLAVWVLGKRRR